MKQRTLLFDIAPGYMRDASWRMWYFWLLLVFSGQAILTSALDAYCGKDHFQAVTDCVLECPDGNDSECMDLGLDYSCFTYTGCTDRFANNGTAYMGTNSSIFDANSTSINDTNTSIFDVDLNETNMIDANLNGTSLSNASTSIEPTFPPVKTKRPTLSPTPNPYLVSLNTAARNEINGNAASTTLSSYGFIFNMRTTADSSALHIVGFDFLTASTENLDFELYSAPGSFMTIKGKYGRWIMMGKGTVKGQGIGTLTSITSHLINPIPMDGRSSTRAFYVTLQTKDMLFRAIGSGSEADKMVQLASDQVELYEGESVHGFPFPDQSTGAYAGPHQFIGAVHIDTVPCKPLDIQGYVYTLPCPVIPTFSPAPSSAAPTTLSPTISRIPSMSPTYQITAEPSYMPTTESPTSSQPPTMSPTQSPMESIPTEANIVITLRNTLNRNMTIGEEEFFIYELLEFFFLHTPETLTVDDARVWYQERVEWVAADARKTRWLEGLDFQEFESRAVTMILQAAYFEASFSEPDIGSAIVDIIQQNNEDFVIALRGGDAAYFMQVGEIQARAIEQATVAPVATPALQAAEPSSSVGVYAGVGVGAFALCFLGIGLSYYFIKKSYPDKEFYRGNTNSSDSKDIETGHLPSSSECDVVPKLASSIDDMHSVDDSKCSDYRSSQDGGQSESKDEENSLVFSRSSRDNSSHTKDDHLSSCTNYEKNPVPADDVPEDQNMAENSSVSGADKIKSKKDRISKLKKNKKGESKSLKKSKLMKSKASKPNKKKKQKLREEEAVNTDQAIVAILSNNHIKRKHKTDSSSEYSSSSDSSASKPKKPLQKAVKASDVKSSRLEEDLSSYQQTLSEIEQDGGFEGPSFSSKKDNWKTLRQSVKAGADTSADPKKPQHRSRSLIIACSDGDDGNKDHWKRLSQAVNAKEFASSDRDFVSRSQKQRDVDIMQASDNNPESSSMRKSKTSQKKDNWKTLRQSVKAGAHGSDGERRFRQRQTSVGVSRDDGYHLGPPRHQENRRGSCRALLRDSECDLRKLSRDNSGKGSSSKRYERSQSFRRSRGSNDAEPKRSSSQIGSREGLQRSSRNLISKRDNSVSRRPSKNDSLTRRQQREIRRRTLD